MKKLGANAYLVDLPRKSRHPRSSMLVSCISTMERPPLLFDIDGLISRTDTEMSLDRVEDILDVCEFATCRRPVVPIIDTWYACVDVR